MASSSFRIHPAIGFARVGNSKIDDYYIESDTQAGMPLGTGAQTGGLPIKKDTEHTPIDSDDIRDAAGALTKQASRFKIFMYPDDMDATYPSGKGTEVTLGSEIDGQTVDKIVWQSHLANKKANCWGLDDSYGIIDYQSGSTPPVRNGKFADTANPAATVRLEALVIDAGPRAITAEQGSTPTVRFDRRTTPSFVEVEGDDPKKVAKIVALPDYPVSFPGDHFETLICPSGQRVDTLGALTVDAKGRLIVVPGTGTACGWTKAENRESGPATGGETSGDIADGMTPDEKIGLDADVNNDRWFDDTSDGPISATLVLSDGSIRIVDGGAWVVCTDPGYAPQILNVVSLWDNIFDTWVREMGLNPLLFADGAYNESYQPDFADQILRVFRSAALSRWTTNLNDIAINAHDRIGEIKATGDPNARMNVMSFIRDPNNQEQFEVGPVLMPAALGDETQSFLSVTKTQYFFLTQWQAGNFRPDKETQLGDGEKLDRNVLVNCLGGRFSPGIDLTFIVQDPLLYNQDWKKVGPFRIMPAPLNYTNATKTNPFLGIGYVPLHHGTGVEPGDLCKFMAIPWHTDYNSCATHIPAPNPGGQRYPSGIDAGPDSGGPIPYDGTNLTLYWSWPAQRPVSIHTFKDLKANGGNLPPQRFSIRGPGTTTDRADSVGRFQERVNMIKKWQDIGITIQATAVKGFEPTSENEDYYVEVQSLLGDTGDVVEPWPTTVAHPVQKEIKQDG